MRVPMWDCPDLGMIDGPLDTTTVVSEDIWKKFDLDFPDSFSAEQYYGTVKEDGVLPDQYDRTGSYDKCSSSPPASLSLSLSLSLSSSLSRLEAREIRHHDCMWAGLCISKEHNRTLPAKKDLQILNGNGSSGSGSGSGGTSGNNNVNSNNINNKRIVPAGRSLLINRKPQNFTNLTKNLESDGDSTRPETPQSSESETESEDEPPRFKHDSISINEKLSEYLGDATTAGVNSTVGTAAAVPVSEVTGQLMRRIVNAPADKKFGRRSLATHHYNHHHNHNNNNINNNNNNNNSRRSENQRNYGANKERRSVIGSGNGGTNGTPANDVIDKDDDDDDNDVSFANNNNNNNSSRNNKNLSPQPPSIPGIARGSIVSLGDHCYHLNQTSSTKKIDYLGIQTPSDSEEEIDVVTFDKPCRPASLPTNPSAADKQHLQNTVTSALKDTKSPPRPRGRPPSNAPRKRSAQTDPKPAKRQKHKTYQKRGRSGESGGTVGGAVVGSVIVNGVATNQRRSTTIEKGSIESSNTNSSARSQENRFIDNRIESPIKGSNNDRNECGGGAGSGRLAIQERSSNNKSSSSNAATISRSSSDEEPDTEKRSLHNNMERQRRIELRNAFEELRVLVPEVEMKEKAPKVVILRQAAVYCDMLTEMGQATLSKVTELKRQQDRLRTRLSQLRRSFAAAR